MKGKTRKAEMLYAENIELKNLKVLYFLFAFLIIALIVMPQYFGIHIGVDFTCTRFANVFILIYMCMNPKILTHFCRMVPRCEVAIPLAGYLLVAFYTGVLRADVNSFFLVFVEILTFFMMVYAIRYVTGIQKVIQWILGCAYFLSVYGFVEYIYGKSIFLKFLATMPTRVNNDYRSGHYRIMGPCGHSIAYGLLLLLFVAVACYDYKKDQINIFKRPLLLVMLLSNVFLTGSRSSLGVVILELAILFFCSGRKNMKKDGLIIFGMIVAGILLLVLLQNTGIGRYILGQVMSVVDQVFGTNYAAKYGVDVETLTNSTEYRKALPYIFTLDWLNPLLGRGTKFSGAEINGVYIHSIDHYYVSQYIKFAYPGLFFYVSYMVVAAVVLIRDIVKHHSGLAKIVLVALSMYFLNLWWVDALQTLKFSYLYLAIFYAAKINRRDNEKRMKRETRSVNIIETAGSQCSSTGV